MKALLLSVVIVVASLTTFAQDVSKILEDNQCVPVRQADGRISAYKCAGELGQLSTASAIDTMESVSDSSEELSLE